MEPVVEEKPRLSPSSIGTYLRCGEQWRRRYIEGDRIKPGAAMLAGTGAHAAAAADLVEKLRSGKLLTVEQVKDIARDEFTREWENSDIELSEEEKKIGLKKVFGSNVDLSVLFADGHHREFAPKITPVPDRVEWTWRVTTDLPHDILGVIDRMETIKVVENGKRVTRRRVSDFKTTSSKKKPAPDAAGESDQLTSYAIASTVCDGVEPESVALHTLRAERQTDGSLVARPYVSIAKRTAQDYDSFWRKFESVSVGIDREVFLPAQRGMDWWCSEKWCGFAATCPFYAGKVTAAVPGNDTN